MKISIITITYNSAKTLPRALESVQSQKYDEIEHIIVDGASTDGTVELIRKYSDVQSDNVQCTKVLQNGVLLIIRDGKTYNVLGQSVNQ